MEANKFWLKNPFPGKVLGIFGFSNYSVAMNNSIAQCNYRIGATRRRAQIMGMIGKLLLDLQRIEEQQHAAL